LKNANKIIEEVFKQHGATAAFRYATKDMSMTYNEASQEVGRLMESNPTKPKRRNEG
jgi:hypothetical protein